MPEPAFISQAQERAFIGRAFLIALAVRVALVIALRTLPIGLDDMFQYDMLARSIVNGNGFRWYAQPDLALIQGYFTTLQFQIPADYDPRGLLTTFRAPLYPAFLAIIYFFTGLTPERFFIARLVQTLLNAALIPLTYLLARQLAPASPRVARWAALTIAFYPLLVIYPLALATENLFFILFLASALALVWAARQPHPARFALAGLLLGLTALTRSVSLVAAALALAWVFFALRQRRAAVLAALTLALIIAPWIIRNSLLHGRLTGIETSSGYNLYVGYHPQSTGTFTYGPSLDLLPYLDDAERDQIGTQKAIQFIQADPGRVVTLAFYRLGHFFGLERRALTYFYANNFFGHIPFPYLLGIAALVLAPFVIVISSAVPGLALYKWDRPALILPLLALGYTLPHIFLLAEERFHYTLVPFFAILAALYWDSGLSALRTRWRASRAGKILIILALIALFALFFNWGYELHRDWDKLIQLFGPTGHQSGFPY